MTPEQKPSSSPSSRPKDSHASSSSRRPNRNHRMLVILGSLVVLVILAVAAKKFVYPVLKAMRGRQYAAEVQSHQRRGEMEEAGKKLKLALKFGPQEPEVLRAAANYSAAVNNPAAVNYFQMLKATPAVTFEDRTNYISFCLATTRLDLAREELTQLLKQDTNNIPLLKLLVQHHLIARDTGRAILTARYAARLSPTDESLQLTLGSLLTENSRRPGDRAEGRRLLWSLAVGNSAQKGEAVKRLAANRELNAGEIRVLLKMLEAQGKRTFTEDLLVYDLRARADSGEIPGLVKEALGRYLQEHDYSSAASVAAWASSLKQDQTVLEMLPYNLVRTNKVLAPVRLGTLAELGRWSDIQTALEDRYYETGPVLTKCFQAHLAMRGGRKSEAEALFMSALQTEKIGLRDARLIARQAEMAGLPFTAIAVHQKLANDPRLTLESCLEILRILAPIDDLDLVRDTLRRLSQLLPGDDNVAGESAWIDLVTNHRTAEGLQTMRRLHAAYPDNPQWRVGLAVGLWRNGQAHEALVQLQTSELEWRDIQPRMQAAWTAIIGANQQRENARKLARQVDLKRIRAAERALVEPWL